MGRATDEPATYTCSESLPEKLYLPRPCHENPPSILLIQTSGESAFLCKSEHISHDQNRCMSDATYLADHPIFRTMRLGTTNGMRGRTENTLTCLAGKEAMHHHILVGMGRNLLLWLRYICDSPRSFASSAWSWQILTMLIA